jgi:hypothetical protein
MSEGVLMAILSRADTSELTSLSFSATNMTSNNDTANEGDNKTTERPSIPPPDWSRLAFETIPLLQHPDGGFGINPGGYWVTQATLRTAWKLFWAGVNTLDKYRFHSAKALACTPNWDIRPKGWRIAMGRCYKYFAVHRVLPITLVNPDAKCNFQYCLDADFDRSTVHTDCPASDLQLQGLGAGASATVRTGAA